MKGTIKRVLDKEPTEAAKPATIIRKPTPVESTPAAAKKIGEPDRGMARKHVHVHMLDGTSLEGRLDFVSTYMLVLSCEGRRMIVYKHAVAWIREAAET